LAGGGGAGLEAWGGAIISDRGWGMGGACWFGGGVLGNTACC